MTFLGEKKEYEMDTLQKEVNLLREKVALLEKIRELQASEEIKTIYVPVVTYPIPQPWPPQDPWYNGTPDFVWKVPYAFYSYTGHAG